MAKNKKKEKNAFTEKLRSKYRLVILNDDTFEEKLSLKLSRLNVFFVLGVAVIVLISSTVLLIALTPLKEYIPGYSSTQLRRQAIELQLSADSVKTELAYNQRYLLNLKNIINGNPIHDYSDTTISDSIIQYELNRQISHRDAELRALVEEEEKFNLLSQSDKIPVGSGSFFNPIKGLITDSFSLEKTHLGIDIVGKPNEIIKSIQDGIVVFTDWTAEGGYVLLIQHPADYISVYKHNSALLKQQGSLVKAGEPIAIIGNSGEQSTGPHLHFELWYRGNAVNPTDYLAF